MAAPDRIVQEAGVSKAPPLAPRSQSTASSQTSGGENAAAFATQLHGTPAEVSRDAGSGVWRSTLLWLIADNRDLIRSQIPPLVKEFGLRAAHTALIGEVEQEMMPLAAELSDRHGVDDDRANQLEHLAALKRLRDTIDGEFAAYRADITRFTEIGKEELLKLLRNSLAQTERERARYGVDLVPDLLEGADATTMTRTLHVVDNDLGETKALRATARSLLPAVDALVAAQQSHNPGLGLVRDTTDPAAQVLSVVDPVADAAWHEHVNAAQKAYDEQRKSAQGKHAILGAIAETRDGAEASRAARQLRELASGGGAQLLGAAVEERLESTELVRAAVESGAVTIWDVPALMGPVKRVARVSPGSALERVIDDEAGHLHDLAIAEKVLFAVIALALAVAAAPLTGGASIGAGTAIVAGGAAVASGGLGVWLAYSDIQEYRLADAMNKTAFDRADALSQEDPSLFWLGLSIAGAALDAKGMIDAFKALRPLARAASRAGHAPAQVAAFRKAASDPALKLPEREVDQLVAKAERIAHDTPRNQAAEFAEWESHLNDESKKLIHDDGAIGAVFHDMDPEVRKILTHCASVCIPPNVKPEQAKRLRALLDRIPETEREGLAEFLHASANDLDPALEVLERLHADGWDKAVSGHLEALHIDDVTRDPLVNVGGRIEGLPTWELGRDLIRRVQVVLTTKISEAPKDVGVLWQQAVEAVKKRRGLPTKANAVDFYEATRNKFWDLIRAAPKKPSTPAEIAALTDEQRSAVHARAWFEEHGFVFQKGRAPRVDYPGQAAPRAIGVELDHMRPKAGGDNWQHVVDPDEIQFVLGWDNWLLNEAEKAIPELRRP